MASDEPAGGVDVRVEAIVGSLQARADNAYCEYLNRLRRDECLGWEIKTERGLFREPELKAHTAAAEMLGRHRALSEAAQLLREALAPNAGLNRPVSRSEAEAVGSELKPLLGEGGGE